VRKYQRGKPCRKTALALAFKLILSVKQKCRKLGGSNQPAELIKGVSFKDRIELTKHTA
jgi:hypothetical protein